MNRRIQFRGKTEDHRWVEGSLVSFAGDYWIVHAELTPNGKTEFLWDKVDKRSIGQYIVTIRHTVIYEGDIVLLKDIEYGEEYRGEVVLDYLGPRLLDERGGLLFTRTYEESVAVGDNVANLYDMLEYELHDFRIVGNVHESIWRNRGKNE